MADTPMDNGSPFALRRTLLKGLGLAAGIPMFLGQYVRSAWGAREDSGEVTVIDTEANKVVARLPVGYSPTFITIPRRSRFAYVTNYGFGLFDRPRNTLTVTECGAYDFKFHIAIPFLCYSLIICFFATASKNNRDRKNINARNNKPLESFHFYRLPDC